MNHLFHNSQWSFGFLVVLCASLVITNGSQKETPKEMAIVSSGYFKPLFKTETDSPQVHVSEFLLDKYPVTNGDFLEFVQSNPRWKRSSIKCIFADEHYLQHWSGDFDLGSAHRNQPVVWVSWFAAKAYATWKGKRLPTVVEWEYAATASPTRPDGNKDPAFSDRLRKWLSTPSPEHFSEVGAGTANYYGVYDLHELVWEWTSDFNSAAVTGDARGDTGLDRQLFCGAGSIGSTDPDNFPAFMRYGFRSSLKANYTIHNLGFRCARSRNLPMTEPQHLDGVIDP